MKSDRQKTQEHWRKVIFLWCAIFTLLFVFYFIRKNMDAKKPEPNWVEEVTDEELSEIELDK